MTHAIEHKMKARIPLIKLSEIRLHTAAENWPAARAALSEIKEYPISVDDRNTRAEWAFYEARVALHDGDIPRVERIMEQFGTVPHWLSANRRAAILAIRLRVELAREAPPDSIWLTVRDLDATHATNRNIGNQDFEAFALFLGLSAIGEGTKGWHQLQDYVATHRMTRRMLSSEIRELQLRASELCLRSGTEPHMVQGG